MDLVLRWDPPEGAAAGVLYTAELRWVMGKPQVSHTRTHTHLHTHICVSTPPPRSKVRNFTVCVNTSSTSCDFSRLNFSVYGRYTGWVTALLGDESSGWANSNRVIPDMDSEDRPSSRQLLHACLPSPHQVFSLFVSHHRSAERHSVLGLDHHRGEHPRPGVRRVHAERRLQRPDVQRHLLGGRPDGQGDLRGGYDGRRAILGVGSSTSLDMSRTWINFWEMSITCGKQPLPAAIPPDPTRARPSSTLQGILGKSGCPLSPPAGQKHQRRATQQSDPV